jgi:MOSC domain-containing protein YiiM
MSIVLTGGEIHAGDRIDVELPPPPHESLDRV